MLSHAKKNYCSRNSGKTLCGYTNNLENKAFLAPQPGFAVGFSEIDSLYVKLKDVSNHKDV